MDRKMDSGQALRLAVNFHQAGNLAEAETLYRRVLQAEPRNAEVLHLLGLVAHQLGRNDLAVDYIRQALRVRPEFPAALNNLGICLKDLGRLDEAIANYQQALRLNPDFAEAYYNLGNVLRDQGKLDQAITSYQHALRRKPNYVEAYNNLGNALEDLGKVEEAIANYQQALRLRPNHAEAYNNLGNALKIQGRFEEAISNHQQALRLKPNFAEAYNNLGNALMGLGKVEEAVASFRQAVRLKPELAGAHNNLGNGLRSLWKDEEAVTSYQQALRIMPSYADAHSNLGVSLTELGRIDEAIASFHEAIRWNPKQAEAMCQLAGLLRGKLPEADCALLEQRLADSDLVDSDRVKLLFGLAEVCDARSEHARATALLRQANALSLSLRRQNGQNYDFDKNARFVANLMGTFTPAFFERMRGFGLETERPVFIIGLPRSGTTLTEQILGAHSQVFGAGELTLARQDFLALGTQPTDESVFTTLPGLGRDAIQRVAQRHLDQLAVMNGTAARVVDKMPDNYFHLGLLATLFPRAKFIHCRRDLRDVAVSCWFTNFRDYHWANDPEHIAARFQEYHRLMEHWRRVLPVSVLEFHYEETVTDLQRAARKLVEWCGLDWEPACLAFHDRKNLVRTASVSQVRQPVYTKSVARWRNYEGDLGSLFTALAPLLDAND
jgi:tetratricopeptide (TPR) repeat protein